MHPNPLVGAVLLSGGELVGEGYHAEDGGEHAEAGALAAAGVRARGATSVVTLEPCAHAGRQPPCAEALVRAGVRRVVVAVRDPNPLAKGGIERLRAAGLEVELGLMAPEAEAQNAVFLHRFRDASRPYVALKLATTLDGRIADARGRSRWISGSEARDYVHWLRAGFGALAVGGRTAAHDDPSLTVRGPLVPRVTPTRVVFDRSLVLRADSVLARTAGEVPTIVITTSAAARDTDDLLARGIQVLIAATPAEGLRRLREEGIMSVLVEGGGRLAGALLGEGLVDRYYWIQSPVLLGERGVPAISGLPESALASAARWAVVERRALGADTLLVLDRQACSPES